MPTYIWQGKSKQGEVKRGELVADNPAVARLQLRKMGIQPNRIQEKRDQTRPKNSHFEKEFPKN